MRYKLLQAGDYLSLERQVNIMIDKGWIPLGGPTMLGKFLTQAVTKEELV